MKFTLLALVAVLSLSFAGLGQAQTAAKTTTTSTSATAVKKTPYRGTVKAVDAKTITVTSSKGTDMTLTINSMTKYKGGADISAFKVGDKVTGSYMKDASGTMVACSVHKK